MEAVVASVVFRVGVSTLLSSQVSQIFEPICGISEGVLVAAAGLDVMHIVLCTAACALATSLITGSESSSTANFALFNVLGLVGAGTLQQIGRAKSEFPHPVVHAEPVPQDSQEEARRPASRAPRAARVQRDLDEPVILRDARASPVPFLDTTTHVDLVHDGVPVERPPPFADFTPPPGHVAPLFTGSFDQTNSTLLDEVPPVRRVRWAPAAHVHIFDRDNGHSHSPSSTAGPAPIPESVAIPEDTPSIFTRRVRWNPISYVHTFNRDDHLSRPPSPTAEPTINSEPAAISEDPPVISTVAAPSVKALQEPPVSFSEPVSLETARKALVDRAMIHRVRAQKLQRLPGLLDDTVRATISREHEAAESLFWRAHNTEDAAVTRAIDVSFLLPEEAVGRMAQTWDILSDNDRREGLLVKMRPREWWEIGHRIRDAAPAGAKVTGECAELLVTLVSVVADEG